MVYIGHLIRQYEVSFSRMFDDILLPSYKRFPLSIFDGFGMVSGEFYSSGHLVSYHFGIAYTLFVEANLFPELVLTFLVTL